MKTVLTKFLAFGSIALLALASCKKNDPIVKTNGGTAGALTSNTASLVLDKTRLTDTTTVISFNFGKAVFGFSAAVTNTLQIDAPGDNWATPASVTLGTNVYSQGYATAVFNALLLKLNLPAGVASQVSVRVESSLGGASKPVYSNVLSITVTPFNLTSYLYVPGAYEGWANPGPQEDSLVSVTGNGVYVGIINFTAGNNQFLVVPVKNWNNKYATNDNTAPGATSSNFSVTYNGSNNFQAPTTAGQYLVTLNLNSNTITMVPADYYSIIGSSTPGGNWSTDLFLKFINDGNNNWVGTFTLLAGQFKIRQDAAWTNSWGDISPADGVHATSSNGGNINATAGTHTVTFNMPATPFGTTTYTNLPTYNQVPFPLVTTTYSLQ